MSLTPIENDDEALTTTNHATDREQGDTVRSEDVVVEFAEGDLPLGEAFRTLYAEIADTRSMVSEQGDSEELWRTLESIQDEVSRLRSRVGSIEDSAVSENKLQEHEERLHQLELTASKSRYRLDDIAQRIESLTELSAIDGGGTCTACGGSLVVDELLLDLGSGSSIECEDCGTVVERIE